MTTEAKLSVVHTSPAMGPSYGGPFQSVRSLAKAQLNQGIEVEMRMPFSREAERHLGDWLPVKVSVSGRVALPPLGWSPRYGRELLGLKTDILHTHGIWEHPSWVALQWKRHSLGLHVASARGMLEPWAWRYKAWKKRPVWWLLEKRNLQTAALLHATSEVEAQGLRARGLTSPIAVIPNGVDLPPADAVTRRDQSNKQALFLSRLHPVKGLSLLLKAWAKIKPSEWTLLIVGPDERDHQAELEQLVVELGLANVVSFTGALEGASKSQAFIDSDLFILPTYSENFGIAVAEAMSFGLPVITTHGAPWQVLEQENCGWWVPVSVVGIAEALRDAIGRQPEELIAMGERGRTVVTERFAWDGIAQQFIDCYRWILGRGAKPDCIFGG